jgi:hypothetical protein
MRSREGNYSVKSYCARDRKKCTTSSGVPLAS